MPRNETNRREEKSNALTSKTVAVLTIGSTIVVSTASGGVAAALIIGGKMAVFAGCGLGLLGSSSVMSNGLAGYINDGINTLFKKVDNNIELDDIRSQSETTEDHNNEVTRRADEFEHSNGFSDSEVEENEETDQFDSQSHANLQEKVAYSPVQQQRGHSAEVVVNKGSKPKVGIRSPLFDRKSPTIWSSSPSSIRKRAVGNEEKHEIENNKIETTPRK